MPAASPLCQATQNLQTMALTKTLDEIAEVLPKLVSSLSDFSGLPNFDRTEYKYIVPVIGPTLYAALQTAYDADTLDANETALIKHIRLATAAFAFYDDIGLYILSFKDSGVAKVTQGGTEPVRAWEANKTEATLIKTAHEGIELLLNYLFDNKALFPEWTGSEQYSKIKSLLITTGTQLNDNYTVYQPQRTFFIIKSIMNDVQRLYLEETIGKDLLEYLRDKASPTADEITCLDLLKKALVFFSIVKACRNFSVSFTDNGFTILGDKNGGQSDTLSGQQLDFDLLELKMQECQKDGDSYLELARNQLVKLYNDAGAAAEFKTAFAKGILVNYIQPADRTSGNETRKIYRLP